MIREGLSGGGVGSAIWDRALPTRVFFLTGVGLGERLGMVEDGD